MNILNTSEKGFTLIEFVVIMSIFGIMASISLFNFSGFSSNISLSNLTHDVALVIRQAQVAGISGVSDDPTEPVAYGVYFRYDNPTSSYANEMIFFEDTNGNNMPDLNTGEDIDTISIKSSDKISTIQWGSPLGSCSQQDVRIFFKRPDPKPLVYCGTAGPEYGAKVDITSSDGSRTRSIDIFSTGQISVD